MLWPFMYICLRFCRKVGETVGLQLTQVQEVYWRAAQRRMVMTQLEDMVNETHYRASGSVDNLLANEEIKELPFDLYKAMTSGDPGTIVIIVH